MDPVINERFKHMTKQRQVLFNYWDNNLLVAKIALRYCVHPITHKKIIRINSGLLRISFCTTVDAKILGAEARRDLEFFARTFKIPIGKLRKMITANNPW